MIEVIFVIVIGGIIMSVVFSPSEQQQIKKDLVGIKKQAIDELHKANQGVDDIKNGLAQRLKNQEKIISDQDVMIANLKRINVVLKAQKEALEAQLEALPMRAIEPELKELPEYSEPAPIEVETTSQFDYKSDFESDYK